MANKPNIRFKGFTDDWEQRKLGEDLESIQTGTNLLGSENNNGMPLLKMGNIQRGYFDTSKLEYLVDNKSVEPENVAYYGDFFFNTRNTMELVGKGATWTGEGGKYAFNSNIARFKLKGIDTIFFNFLYNTDSMAKQVHARAMGTTSVAAIYPRSLDSIDYCLPCIDEQKRIGDYFRNLDHLITLHQRKCDETKKLKIFMLQKMFPKNGEKNPEIRFAGFTDDWEQRKLGDILERRIEQRRQSADYPRLAFASGQGVIPLSERKTNNREQLTKDEFTKKYLVTEMNDIVYNPANVKYGAIDRNKFGRGLISPIYVTFTTREDTGFIERIVTSHEFQQKALRFEEGTVTKRQSVNPEDFVLLDILLSSNKSEQKKVSVFFDTLDHLITLHQRKCDNLKLIKKFMLQNMFPKKG